MTLKKVFNDKIKMRDIFGRNCYKQHISGREQPGSYNCRVLIRMIKPSDSDTAGRSKRLDALFRVDDG